MAAGWLGWYLRISQRLPSHLCFSRSCFAELHAGPRLAGLALGQNRCRLASNPRAHLDFVGRLCRFSHWHSMLVPSSVAGSPTTQPAELSLHFRPRLFHRRGPVLATGRPPYPIPSLHDPSPHGRCPPGICRRACEPSHRGIARTASSPTAANHGPPPPSLLPPPHTATVFRHCLLPLFSRTALPRRRRFDPVSGATQDRDRLAGGSWRGSQRDGGPRSWPPLSR